MENIVKQGAKFVLMLLFFSQNKQKKNNIN